MAKGVSKPEKYGTTAYEDYTLAESASIRSTSKKVKTGLKMLASGNRAITNVQEVKSVRAQERMTKKLDNELHKYDKADGNNDYINRRSQENL